MNVQQSTLPTETMGSPSPGPWTVEAVFGEDAHDICAPSTPETGSPNVIAGVLYDDESDSLAQANANARLIAAAPDLLEALKNMAGFCATGCVEAEMAMDDARKAIAKAEGRS